MASRILAVPAALLDEAVSRLAYTTNGGRVAVELAIWRLGESRPHKLQMSPLDRERRLEHMLVEDPSIAGTELLVLGRQVATAYGGSIDLLGLDEEGRAHVLELKRDRTPRDEVAQTLDYGSWVAGLGLEDLERIFSEHHPGEGRMDEAFFGCFGRPLPEIVNDEQQFTLVASELDPTSDRIIEFLAESYGVPINAVFFRHFSDGGNEYLARTWLLDSRAVEDKSARSRSKRRPWNGRDFYVVLGRADEDDIRWPLASKYGLLSAGGGAPFSKPLRSLTPGHRVFAYVAKAGYVGVGRVVRAVQPARDATVTFDGQSLPLRDLPEVDADREFVERIDPDDPDLMEVVVQVEWLAKRRLEDAFWASGLFANPATCCRLRDEHTIAAVEAEFGIESTNSGPPN